MYKNSVKIWAEYGVDMGIFDSNLPQFKHTLATKQRNIAFTLFGIIAVITILCASYFEVMYEMTFETWIVTIVGCIRYCDRNDRIDECI